MYNNGKETKKTRNISRRMHFGRNGEECNLHNKVWCEGGLQMANNVNNNVREDKLNPKL